MDIDSHYLMTPVGRAKPGETRFYFSTAHKKPGARPGFLYVAVLLSGYSFTAGSTINQLDVRHRRVVASAETALQDAQVATLTGSITLAQVVEELTTDSFRASTVASHSSEDRRAGKGGVRTCRYR